MSARNRGPPPATFRQIHPDFPGDLRDPNNPRIIPVPIYPHPGILQDRLSAQHREIQALLVDNQRLAATHVALRQELELSHNEIRRAANGLGSARADAESRIREAYERAMKLECDLRDVDSMKSEFGKVQSDIKQLGLERQELSVQVKTLAQDLDRSSSELKKVPGLKAEIDAKRQELQRARAAIEYEKNGYAENYEHGQAMEKNLITMAREMEKLRAELANAEKRVRAASTAAVANPGMAYGGSYGNLEGAYGGVNPYPVNYGMHPGQNGAEVAPQYGAGPASWATYDMQWAHGHR